MNKKRIQMVIDMLPKIPPEQFDMSFFWDDGAQCGTVGCIAGHFPSFYPRAGLKRTKSGGVVYGHWYYFDAVEQFFEVRGAEAGELFGPVNAGATPAQMRRKFQNFLKTGSVS